MKSAEIKKLYQQFKNDNDDAPFSTLTFIKWVEDNESQFREPSTQGGERHKKEVDDAWIAGVMSERSAAKDEIERLKQENERLKSVLKKVNTAINNSNMKNTILHSEVKQALNPKD